ncbi:hypothetical protein tb265_11890 [Gemmatimonadetes bacterium T265]|nr:hypothetical protein tb265_11890 [Gemmatimonadetes bacterium T265]
MPIVIDPTTERLVRELADATGTMLDAVVRDAVRARLADVGRRPAPGASIADVQAYIKSLPVIDPRPGDEILYDEFGLPK